MERELITQGLKGWLQAAMAVVVDVVVKPVYRTGRWATGQS